VPRDVRGDANREWASPYVHIMVPPHTSTTESEQAQLKKKPLALPPPLFLTGCLGYFSPIKGQPYFVDPPNPPEPSVFAETTLDHPACLALVNLRC
jgi:hypothetical protein